MKYSSITILSLLLISLVVVPAKELRGMPKPNFACSMPFWRPASSVSVYLVRDMFTAEQRHAVLDALAFSEETRGRTGLAVTFNFAGETDGLIDCEGCLTVARRVAYPNDRKSPTTLHSLRRNNLGQLISAWIEVDRTTNTAGALRGSMLEALLEIRRGKVSSVCKR